MKKESSYLFAAVAFMTSLAVAQEPGKPYRITNRLPETCNIGVQRNGESIKENLDPGQTVALALKDFPLTISPGCDTFGGDLIIPEPNCHIVRSGMEPIREGEPRSMAQSIDTNCPIPIKPPSAVP